MSNTTILKRNHECFQLQWTFKNKVKTFKNKVYSGKCTSVLINAITFTDVSIAV